MSSPAPRQGAGADADRTTGTTIALTRVTLPRFASQPEGGPVSTGRDQTCLRAALTAAVVALPLTTTPPAASADADLVALPMTLKQAVAALPKAAESREGYQRMSRPRGWVRVSPS